MPCTLHSNTSHKTIQYRVPIIGSAIYEWTSEILPQNVRFFRGPFLMVCTSYSVALMIT